MTTRRYGFIARKMERVRRRLQALACNRACSRQANPLAAHNKMIVTTFYDVEGDYAMPGQSTASIESVARILEIEKRYGVRSTYNMVARFAVDAPDLLAEIHNAGHEIASHSYDHTTLTRLRADDITEQLRQSKMIFQQRGVDVTGHRSPQSAWDHRVMGSLLAEGYAWSAEDGAEPHPYRIHQAGGGNIWRFPVTDDDWCYEQDKLSPGEVLKRWRLRIRQAKQRQTYSAIGFHPWVEAAPDRQAVLAEFLHWLTEQDGIELMPFGTVLQLILEQEASVDQECA